MHRAHIYIEGIVQGVFFRANAQKAAQSLNLTGWVRNTNGGGVETIAEGAKENLEKFISWCRKGPPSARVENVKAEWEKETGEFKDFMIRY
ncbi:MAG: acylphosphatase [Deltaproteobacteria bacterium]|nr:acylphosphatase [Deltaproteobacteria bacterium]